MEYCNGGSLSDCLMKYGKPFPQEIIQYFMRQIVEGLKYIHSKRIIHRDIKMDNILIKYKNKEDLLNFRLLKSEIKIIDFGLATKLGKDGYAYTFIGSPINMDPLILEGYNEDGKLEKLQKYNEKADIWSLGTICYQMLTGDTVFKVDNFQELIHAARVGIYHIPVKDDITNEMISFILSMLKYYEDCRLSAEEISKHVFLNKNVKEFHPLKLTLNLDQQIVEQLENFKVNSKNNNNFLWIVYKDGAEVGIELDKIDENFMKTKFNENYFLDEEQKEDDNEEKDYTNYSFIDLNDSNQKSDVLEHGFEICKSYKEVAEDGWEVISQESEED
jgi:serine/threonine protein kinase